MEINFQKEKITDLISEGKFSLTEESENYLIDYYMSNYSKVCSNIIDDELVGFAYENLCKIEQMVPKVKQLRKQMY